MTNPPTNVRLPQEILDRLDDKVDGVRYRSRAHLIATAVYDWLDRNDQPLAPIDWALLPQQADEGLLQNTAVIKAIANQVADVLELREERRSRKRRKE